MKAQSVGAKDAASLGLSRAPRAKHLEDEETSRDLFGVVRSFCTKCPCKKYVKRTEEYTVQPGEVGRLHPHNDPGIINCSVCGCPPEAHAVDNAMNEKEQGNDSFELGRYDEAILAYTRGITQKPHDEMLWSNRAAAYLRKGMYDQALHDASRAVQISPSWVKARARKAGAHFHLKQYESAIKEYQMCIKLDPSTSVEYAEALELAKRKAVDCAVKGDTKATRRSPKRMGDEHMKKGSYADAIAFYSQALARDQKDYKVYSNRSAAFAKMQRYQEALQDALSSIKLAPAWPKAWSRKGLALYYLGSLEEAIASYEHCLRLDPGNKEVRKVLSQLKVNPRKEEDQQRENSSVQKKDFRESMDTADNRLDAASLHHQMSTSESLALVQQSLDTLHKLMLDFDTKLNAQAQSISSVLERVAQIEKKVDHIHFAGTSREGAAAPAASIESGEALPERDDSSDGHQRSETDNDSDSFHVVGIEEHLDIDAASVSSQSTEVHGECAAQLEMQRCVVGTDEISEEGKSNESDEDRMDSKHTQSEGESVDAADSTSPVMDSNVHPVCADSASDLESNSNTENESDDSALSGNVSKNAQCESSGEREDSIASKKTVDGSSFKVRADDLLKLFQSTEKSKARERAEEAFDPASVQEVFPQRMDDQDGRKQECPPEERSSDRNGEGNYWDVDHDKSFSSFNQNEKDDARKVFEDVWNTFDEEEEEGIQEQESLEDDDQRWFDLQEEWTRVKEFCDLNRDVIKPPFREKRPFHETAKAVEGASARKEAVLDITNLSQSFNKVSSETRLQRDWFGVLRGACKTYGPDVCPSFRPSFQGCPAPQRLFERAVGEKRNDLMELALQWSSLPPGKFCLRCGCPSNEHESEQEYEKRLRINAILKKKQDDIRKSKASEQEEEENLRKRRVKEAIFRQKEAEVSGEYIRETSLDFITQVKRGPCIKSKDCPGFKVIFRESDALNPEIMLYCSLCGYPSGDHPVDENWESEQKRRKERENRRFNQDYSRFRSQARTRRVRANANPYNEVRRSACAILGVSIDATAAQISRAYKKKALKWHPDKNSSPQAQELFVRLTHAFQLLQKA